MKRARKPGRFTQATEAEELNDFLSNYHRWQARSLFVTYYDDGYTKKSRVEFTKIDINLQILKINDEQIVAFAETLSTSKNAKKTIFSRSNKPTTFRR
jgi:EAL domain-containing protein (putative c-di-GMP-specific phosphodiesterase class I)